MTYFDIDIGDLLVLLGICVGISLIWFVIYYNLKRKETRGGDLSPKAKEWMVVSKIAGCLFLTLPLLAPPIMWLFDLVGGLIGIIILIGIPGVLLSIIKKGKL